MYLWVDTQKVCAQQCASNRTQQLNSPRNLVQFGRRSNTGPLICVLPSPRTHLVCRHNDYATEPWTSSTLWDGDNLSTCGLRNGRKHDGVIKWKHFPRYWPFVWGIHRSPVNSPHKGQWRGAVVFSLICAWTNGWVNNCDPGGLRCHRSHYDVTVIVFQSLAVIVLSVWWVCGMNDTQQFCTQGFADHRARLPWNYQILN